MMEIDVKIYQTKAGKEPYTQWLKSLKSKQDRLRVLKRVELMRVGHFGDSKPLGDGVYELRFFFGAGYRVYYGLDQGNIVLLLCGGDKSGQNRDIKQAKACWKTYKE
jgi:putative addiction module killer protein